MKVIIVDDEQNCREVINKFISIIFPEIKVISMESNIEDAYLSIKKHSPDLLFLDIEIGEASGFDLLKKFDNPNFNVIFTTAYDNYAIQAIKLQAIDYLLKPIDIDEFKNSVLKVKKLLQARPEKTEFRKVDINSKISIPIKDGIVFINVSNIIRIESEGGYSIFFTSNNEKYVVAKNLIEYESILPSSVFFRVHKSHLVNIKKVKKYIRTDGNFLEMTDGALVEISRRKKDEFFTAISSLINIDLL